MDLSKIVSITGMPGLFEVKGNRSNGMIAKSMLTGKSQFISIRTHAFSMLNNISIYTMTDSVELDEIFKKMLLLEQAGSEVPAGSASSKDLRSYFKEVLPEHDEDRVYASDIKKVVKWFHLLKEKDLLSLEDETETDETAINEEE